MRVWRSFGVVCIAIGLINAFVPLLPTTMFLILGAWAFGKGATDLRRRCSGNPAMPNRCGSGLSGAWSSLGWRRS
jgi:uncharacterized membrane protein YbaN (DUF454 family)